MSQKQDDARQEQLHAAAEALIGWIHARRDVWSDEAAMMSEFSDEAAGTAAGRELSSSRPPLVAPPVYTPPPPPVFTPPPPVFTPPPVYEPPPPVFEPPPPVFTPPPPVFTPPPPVFTPPPPEFTPAPAEFTQAPAFTPPPPAVFTPPPPVYAAAPSAASEAFDRAAFQAEPPVAKPTKPAARLQIPTDAIQSLTGPLIRWGLRAAILVVAFAVLVVGARIAWPYAGKVKALMTSLSTPASPAPEKPVAKPTPPPAAAARRTGGVLVARSEPPGARVLVDGRDRGVTPLTLNDVPFGPHTVVIQSDKGSVQRTVTVAADRTALVSESIFAGWLNVYAPFEIQIFEGTRAIRLGEDSRVLLAPGQHDLRFESRDLGYQETRTVEVEPGQTTSVSLAPPASALNVTSTVPAVVLIDGAQVGDTPLTGQPIALGTREIIVRSADGERRFNTKVTVAPVVIDVDFSRP